jgi:hypothetical protein
MNGALSYTMYYTLPEVHHKYTAIIYSFAVTNVKTSRRL